MWEQFADLDESEFLNEPLSLRHQILATRSYDMLRRVPLFLQCDQAFLNSLIVSMQSNVFGPGMVILRQNELSNIMFVVGDGVCEQDDADGKLVRLLGPGTVFNIASLFFPKPASGNVRARTYTEVFGLPKQKFQQIVIVQHASKTCS